MHLKPYGKPLTLSQPDIGTVRGLSRSQLAYAWALQQERMDTDLAKSRAEAVLDGNPKELGRLGQSDYVAMARLYAASSTTDTSGEARMDATIRAYVHGERDGIRKAYDPSPEDMDAVRRLSPDQLYYAWWLHAHDITMAVADLHAAEILAGNPDGPSKLSGRDLDAVARIYEAMYDTSMAMGDCVEKAIRMYASGDGSTGKGAWTANWTTGTVATPNGTLEGMIAFVNHDWSLFVTTDRAGQFHWFTMPINGDTLEYRGTVERDPDETNDGYARRAEPEIGRRVLEVFRDKMDETGELYDRYIHLETKDALRALGYLKEETA